jgi:hypothetical protein
MSEDLLFIITVAEDVTVTNNRDGIFAGFATCNLTDIVPVGFQLVPL